MPEGVKTAKRRVLRQGGTLNPRPGAVTHALFRHREFFDPDDLVQVKYEMLRQVQVDQQPVRRTAPAFGLSRPSFYQAQGAFRRAGLAGLLPRKRGPHSGHKLTAEVMAFVRAARTAEPAVSVRELAQRIRARFDVSVHPRSIARQLSRQKKGP
jgi:transposase